MESLKSQGSNKTSSKPPLGRNPNQIPFKLAEGASGGQVAPERHPWLKQSSGTSHNGFYQPRSRPVSAVSQLIQNTGRATGIDSIQSYQSQRTKASDIRTNLGNCKFLDFFTGHFDSFKFTRGSLAPSIFILSGDTSNCVTDSEWAKRPLTLNQVDFNFKIDGFKSEVIFF